MTADIPIETGIVIGVDPSDGQLVCKFNLNVMPGLAKSWCVADTKRWKMMATCCGDLESCALACNQSLVEWGKSRPFVYVTVNGEAPEVESPPFVGMPHTGFVADCDTAVLCDLCKLPGVRAIEIRKQRSPPQGYRVRIFHDGSVPSDPALYIDPTLLYDMGRTRAGSKAGKGKTKKKKLTEEEAAANFRAAELAAAQNEEYVVRSTNEVAAKLEEQNTDAIARAVRYAGMDVVTNVLEETTELEKTGGMLTHDGTRRRKPGGVFMQLLQNSLSPEQYMLIYQRMPSPSILGQQGRSIPEQTLSGSASSNMAIPARGSMLGEDIALSTSLGASPAQSLLLGGSLGSGAGSFDPHAKAFVPGSFTKPAMEGPEIPTSDLDRLILSDDAPEYQDDQEALGFQMDQ